MFSMAMVTATTYISRFLVNWRFLKIMRKRLKYKGLKIRLILRELAELTQWSYFLDKGGGRLVLKKIEHKGGGKTEIKNVKLLWCAK